MNLGFVNLILSSQSSFLRDIDMERKVRYAFCCLLIATLITLVESIFSSNVSFASCESVINPSNTQLSLTIKPSTAEIGKLVFLTARLTDENGTPIENAKITFKLKNLVATVTTGNEGIAAFAFTPQVIGSYQITVEYAGSSIYSPATKTGTITVHEERFSYASAVVVTAFMMVIAIVLILIVIVHKRRVLWQ